MSRRKGRIIAVQGLYSFDLVSTSIEDLLSLNWVDSEALDLSNETPESREETLTFARLLIDGTVKNLEEIDSLIKKYMSEKWTIERINKVALAVLRLSIYTLLYSKDISPSIVIDEAISIARDFGAEDSYKFINAVLDKISKETVS
ncbi:MAG: transcription antitermination factor NusB [Treponema sp.]|nr:transcription antitermination factor NusB [Treponema sp.]